MKRLFRNIIIFLLIYVIVHILVICICGYYVTFYRIGSNGHMYSRIKEIEKNKNPDILFLGSSLCYRGFDTREFQKHGIKSFNLGSSSQTPKQTEILLKRYLDKINPNFIVFEISPMVFLEDGIESTTDLLSNDHIDSEIIKLAIESGNIKVFNTLMYALFQEYICGIRDYFVEDVAKDGDSYVSGGFVERVEYSPFDKRSGTNPIVNHDVRHDQIEAFEHCLNIIRSKNIPYILVSAPLPESIYSQVNYKEFGNLVSTCGKYIDFNEYLHLNDTCFYDYSHLSQPGVVVFDNCLIQMLDTINLSK